VERVGAAPALAGPGQRPAEQHRRLERGPLGDPVGKRSLAHQRREVMA
jgi:hypothetical protein